MHDSIAFLPNGQQRTVYFKSSLTYLPCQFLRSPSVLFYCTIHLIHWLAGICRFLFNFVLILCILTFAWATNSESHPCAQHRTYILPSFFFPGNFSSNVRAGRSLRRTRCHRNIWCIFSTAGCGDWPGWIKNWSSIRCRSFWGFRKLENYFLFYISILVMSSNYQTSFPIARRQTQRRWPARGRCDQQLNDIRTAAAACINRGISSSKWKVHDVYKANTNLVRVAD